MYWETLENYQPCYIKLSALLYQTLLWPYLLRIPDLKSPKDYLPRSGIPSVTSSEGSHPYQGCWVWLHWSCTVQDTHTIDNTGTNVFIKVSQMS